MSKSTIINITQKITSRDQTSLHLYLAEIRTNPLCNPIDKAVEKRMFNEYILTQNPEIKHRLIMAHLRWVVTVAKQYETKKITLADLINEGNIALLTAFDKYNPNNEQNAGFLYFTSFYIRRELNEFSNTTGSDIAQPGSRFMVKKYVRVATDILRSEGNYEPSSEDIFDVYQTIDAKNKPTLTVALLNEINAQKQGFVSSSMTLGDAEGAFTLEQTFAAGSEYKADSLVNTNERTVSIKKAIETILTEKEAFIVISTFGIGTDDPKSAEHLATVTNYTRERIGQILKKSIEKLSQHKNLMYQILAGGDSDSVDAVKNTEYAEF